MTKLIGLPKHMPGPGKLALMVSSPLIETVIIAPFSGGKV